MDVALRRLAAKGNLSKALIERRVGVGTTMPQSGARTARKGNKACLSCFALLVVLACLHLRREPPAAKP